ncbi:hypothetical protein VF14_06275 [Nostoc linckia z18]|uniref:Uncharacterized protein n=2 Tax=Nostoc linckia TaxID=92942 RepID=A0A9Q5ZBD0_NOSLI|nr:hypothetical protein VF02_15770 [Nostoc linckia z1]PHJ72282.1 hypothetical protein VF05_04960 [Nostoc linckia z3]PHJ75722.1 hypothetical protein VF03_09765 [Nostoc linckia z2]PHJ85332.1 hypothetical protein VF06_07075 [Nostoc linckia z4]PHJ89655.1 hypothetical protein VF07_11640 [Nostoc linckia z6]PHJ97763.1 hypothetical protein VF04_11675 [Nostoc linckia z7]PHK02763.1 hypothetical protein VF08_17700 [Nostoc linckia z8]PHK10118.1 hypothetical protein VF09_12690 [Nostoc linckia z9]PHK2301
MGHWLVLIVNRGKGKGKGGKGERFGIFPFPIRVQKAMSTRGLIIQNLNNLSKDRRKLFADRMIFL